MFACQPIRYTLSSMSLKEALRVFSISKSSVASNTSNPIRQLVDFAELKPNPKYKPISLSLGDPTLCGDFKPPGVLHVSLGRVATSTSFDGYTHACGSEKLRSLIASALSEGIEPALTANDVFLTSGCSQSIEMCLKAVCNPGQSNVVIPNPGFSLYKTLLRSMGVEVKTYELDSSKAWEVDLQSLRRSIDANTSAVIVNNPSNPCGSNYTKAHLQAIYSTINDAGLARTRAVPIISDEVYDGIVYDGDEFVPLASCMDRPAIQGSKDAGVKGNSSRPLNITPVLTVGSLSKKFMVPGWRMGWIGVFNPVNDRVALDVAAEVKQGLADLCTLTLAPSSIVQASALSVFNPSNSEHIRKYLKRTVNALQNRRDTLLLGLGCSRRDIQNGKSILETAVPGVSILRPQAALYAMMTLDESRVAQGLSMDQMPGSPTPFDVQFIKQLMRSKSVLTLPGSIFGKAGCVRLVFSSTKNDLIEASKRIVEFCRNN